ncbi:MAG: hypothetical protein GY737_00410, partial [Desulfobacteraceae bacterium]|nr:hypothetical protein [Desulfobacteraceae bacterium]
MLNNACECSCLHICRSDPVLCARSFHHRVHSLLTTMLKQNRHGVLGRIEDFALRSLSSLTLTPIIGRCSLLSFCRIEFQQRGSPHAHIIFWVTGAPQFDI